MKKRSVKTGALAGGIILASSLLSGCFGPFTPYAVYGPPPERETPAPTQSFDPADNLPAPVYGPAPDTDWNYDPEANIPECVYGPPSYFGIDEEEPDGEDAETSSPEETEAQP